MTNKTPTNTFKHYAMKYFRELKDERELMNQDWTPLFFAELRKMLAAKEIIIIQIHGKPRLGKSTVAMSLGQWILLQMRELGQTKEVFGMYHIARNQYELSKKHREPDRGNTVLVSDELNTLEETGANSTIEMALREQFSDVQAGRYIHKILVSPKDTLDKNTDLFLEVVQPDKERQVTVCLLWYELFYGGQARPMLLGKVEIDVSEVIKGWLKVEKIFLDKEKTEEQKQLIQKEAGKDFYIEYMIKKYEKMDLLNRHNIMLERELDYAEPIMKVVEALKPLVKSGGNFKHLIRQYLKIEYWKRGIPLSLLGTSIEEQNILGILELHKGYYENNIELQKLERLLQAGKLQNGAYKERKQELEKVKQDLCKSIETLTGHYTRMIEIKTSYNKLLG